MKTLDLLVNPNYTYDALVLVKENPSPDNAYRNITLPTEAVEIPIIHPFGKTGPYLISCKLQYRPEPSLWEFIEPVDFSQFADWLPDPSNHSDYDNIYINLSFSQKGIHANHSFRLMDFLHLAEAVECAKAGTINDLLSPSNRTMQKLTRNWFSLLIQNKDFTYSVNPLKLTEASELEARMDRLTSDIRKSIPDSTVPVLFYRDLFIDSSFDKISGRYPCSSCTVSYIPSPKVRDQWRISICNSNITDQGGDIPEDIFLGNSNFIEPSGKPEMLVCSSSPTLTLTTENLYAIFMVIDNAVYQWLTQLT